MLIACLLSSTINALALAGSGSDVSDDLSGIGIKKPEVRLDETFLNETFTRESITRIYDDIEPALVVVNYAVEVYNKNSQRTQKRNGYSLGVIVSPDGLLMAPGHVSMPDAEPFDVRVTLTSRKQYEAHVLPKNKNLNVVFFQIDSPEKLELPHINFVDRQLHIGEQVMAMGMLTRSLDFVRSFETGRVSSIIEQPRKVYTVNLDVKYGYMSGPVIDTRGNVVGVIGRDLAPSEGGEVYVRYDHPVVYPTREFAALIENPPSEEEEQPREDAWLGVFTQPLSDEMAAYWDIEPTGGVLVSGVLPRSPAEKSGVKRGDIIKALNGYPITVRQNAQLPEFTKMVRDVGPGNVGTLTIIRDDRHLEIGVKLAETPKEQEEAERFEDKEFGLTVRELTVDVIVYNELDPDIQGVVVHSVVSAGWTALAGLRTDDIILKIGDDKIEGLDDIERVIGRLKTEKPSEIVVFAQRGSRTAFFRIEPHWDDGQ